MVTLHLTAKCQCYCQLPIQNQDSDEVIFTHYLDEICINLEKEQCLDDLEMFEAKLTDQAQAASASTNMPELSTPHLFVGCGNVHHKSHDGEISVLPDPKCT